MSYEYDPKKRVEEMEATGTDPTYGDWHKMVRHYEDERLKKEREMEEIKNKRQILYNQIEDEARKQAEKQQQKNDLMATSSFKAASIMPQVKSLVADKQFVTSGIAGRTVIDDDIFHAKGGRRRTKRHKKRNGHKRNKRSGKRSGHVPKALDNLLFNCSFFKNYPAVFGQLSSIQVSSIIRAIRHEMMNP